MGELSSKLKGSLSGMHGIFKGDDMNAFLNFFVNSKNKAIRDRKKVEFNQEILNEYYNNYDEVLIFVEHMFDSREEAIKSLDLPEGVENIKLYNWNEIPINVPIVFFKNKDNILTYRVLPFDRFDQD